MRYSHLLIIIHSTVSNELFCKAGREGERLTWSAGAGGLGRRCLDKGSSSFFVLLFVRYPLSSSPVRPVPPCFFFLSLVSRLFPLVVVCVSRSPTVSSVSWVFLRSSSHCVPVPPRLSLCPLIPPLFWVLFFSVFFLLRDGCFVAFYRGLCVVVF